MGHIMTYINECTGVGKTTMTFHTVWCLHQRGYRILVIDFDGQGVTFSSMCGIEKIEYGKSLYHVLEGTCEVSDALITISKNLEVIPFGINLSYMQPNVSMDAFKNFMEEMKDRYDYIFIDVNSMPDWRYALTLSVADYVMIPVDCSKKPAIVDVCGISNIIDDMQEQFHSDMHVLGLVANNVDENTWNRDWKAISKYYELPMFESNIPVSDVINAFAEGDFNSYQKRKVRLLFDAVVDEMLDKM